MTKIEEVRDAIYDAASGPDSLGISEALAEKFAHAAIEAMREPTLRMKGDAWRATLDPKGISCADVERIWSAMIDAALNEEVAERDTEEQGTRHRVE